LSYDRAGRFDEAPPNAGLEALALSGAASSSPSPSA
jgi:hypothetical protein